MRLGAGTRPAVCAGICAALVGCTSSSGSTLSADSAAATIRGAHARDRASIVALDALLGTSAGADAAQRILSSGAAGDAKWFAVYVYANSGVDPAPLRPLLHDRDATIRVVAAAGLVARGDASGFQVLVDSLGDTSTLRASAPPTPVWMVATQTLARMIGDSSLGPPFDADAGRRDLAHRRWSQWLAANHARLHWDSATDEWSLG